MSRPSNSQPSQAAMPDFFCAEVSSRRLRASAGGGAGLGAGAARLAIGRDSSVSAARGPRGRTHSVIIIRMVEGAPGAGVVESPLDRARRKAYRRLIPLCFISYVIAYVDRSNVAIAKLTMTRDLPGFDNAVIGFGAGVFFIGYFLLEIPGTLIVEKWSARKWIARIMITWGITAAATALVKTPFQFYVVRFMLGLAEAGFYPGVIVYLTHWFASRDRARALAYFFVATPIAQVISPKLSNVLLKIGTDEVVGGVAVHHPEVWGLEGWQWIYIAWGIPAVVLGILVLIYLTDRPQQAKWLSAEERDALLAELEREKDARP